MISGQIPTFQHLSLSTWKITEGYCGATIVTFQQVRYKEKFDKEMKGQRPQYDLKTSKIYQTLKDANTLASEVSTWKDRYTRPSH